MTEKAIGYTFGTVLDIGERGDLIDLDEVELLITENMYDIDSNSLLLSGVQDNPEDGYEGIVERVASWSELELPYSYEELLDAMIKFNAAVNAINHLGDSEEYRFPTYRDDEAKVSHKDVKGYPDGEALTGRGLAAYLGASVQDSIKRRFEFYANYKLPKK